MVRVCFLDTSALVKKYMTEVGSAWVSDSLKIHSALTVNGQKNYFFVSADNRLIDVAQLEGLNVENPNLK